MDSFLNKRLTLLGWTEVSPSRPVYLSPNVSMWLLQAPCVLHFIMPLPCTVYHIYPGRVEPAPQMEFITPRMEARRTQSMLGGKYIIERGLQGKLFGFNIGGPTDELHLFCQ